MSWIATAIVGGSVVSGLLGNKGAKDAAGISAGAADRASQVQQQMYDTTRGDLAPYRDAGVPALQRLMYLMGLQSPTPTGSSRGAAPTREQFTKTTPATSGFNGSGFINGNYFPGDRGGQNVSGMGGRVAGTPASSVFDQAGYDAAMAKYTDSLKTVGSSSTNPNDPEFGSLMKDFSLKDFAADPGYDFRKSEGERSLQRGALARGLDASSGTLRKLMTFNSGLASQEYGNAYGRFNADKSNKFNLLSYLVGGGQNAAAMTGTAGTNAAAGSAQAIMAGGAAGANAAMSGASSWNNAIQGGLSNYMYQQRFDQMMNRMPVFSSSPAMGASGASPSWGG